MEQLRNEQKTGADQNRLWCPFDTQQRQDDGKAAAGSQPPATDALSMLLQVGQAESTKIEAAHQPATQGHGALDTTTARYDRPNDAGKPPSKDTLFARLRNPKLTNAGPRPRASGRPSAEVQSSKWKVAGEEREPQFHRLIRAASVQTIEQKLQHTAHHKPNVDGVRFMLKELIEVRHVKPQARHYEALILANCEARHGSADALYPILAEMERERIGISTFILSAVLKVLSIHPDAQLLTSILETLSGQWATKSGADTIHLILALCRLNQFELALIHLEHLISTSPPPDNFLRSPIPQHVYTTILYRLASPAIADHTAVLYLLYLLTDHNLPISNVCISYLLESAAEALHLNLTLYLWRSHVDAEYIIPSTGLCRNALLTASRNGNAQLARKAGRVLEVRGNSADGVGLQLEDLEMVREAFAGDKEVKVGAMALNRITKRMVELRTGEAKLDKIRRQRERVTMESRDRDAWKEQAKMAQEMEEGRTGRIETFGSSH